MMRPTAALIAALCLTAACLAGEGDPWAGQPRHLQHRMQELADAEARGQLGAEEREQLRRYWATHLYRTDSLNAVESAHYSIAELRLERGEADAALAELVHVLAAASDDVRHLTHLNLGQIYRLNLNDAAKAAEHFDQVEGPLGHRARSCKLAMLEEQGRHDEAAKLLEKQIAETKEPGEKLALLHRLAALYRRQRLADKALATYRRITTEFTPEAVERMHQALQAEVDASFKRLRDLQMQGAGHEAEQVMQGIHRRAEELRFAGRWDEARAWRQAMEKGFRALQEFHRERERQERERHGGGEPRPREEF
jgi:tetratricopeptide (TPR) repeat protein